MTNKFIVYEIWCPLTDVCIYVGKGNAARWERPKNHIAEANRVVVGKTVRNPFKARVIANILAQGLSPIFKIVAEYDLEVESLLEEVRLIAHYGRRDQGLGTLTNLTDGGEGTSGYRHTEESIALMKKIALERVITEETRQWMREIQKKSPKPTAEAMQALADFNRGRKRNPETIRRGFKHSGDTLAKISAGISKALKDKPKSAEHVANQSATLRGRKRKPEHIRRGFTLSDEQKAIISANMSLVHKGKPKSAEQRAKMSIAAKAAHARRKLAQQTIVSKG